jgi:hypothetical protein
MTDPLSSNSNTFPEQPSPVRPSIVERNNVQRLEAAASGIDVADEANTVPSPTATRNSTIYQEPSVPDPFLVDDEHDDDESEDDDDDENEESEESEDHKSPVPPAVPSKEDLSQSQLPETIQSFASPPPPDSLASPSTVPVSIPVSLSDSTSPGLQTIPALNVTKDAPPLPLPSVSDTEDDEEETPDIYAPDLIRPTMFLPIPNTDPLTTLLNKFIPRVDDRPVRDLTGDWHRADFNTLVVCFPSYDTPMI